MNTRGLLKDLLTSGFDITLDNDEEDETDDATTNTAEMDERVLAFENLTVYAFTMRSAFEPWLMPCMELSLKALSFGHSEDVREVGGPSSVVIA